MFKDGSVHSDTRILVTGIPDPVDIWKNTTKMFTQYTYDLKE